MLPGSTGVSQGFAVAVAVLSVGGSVHTQSVLPAVYGLLYAACFALAMRGLSSPLQLVLMFAMVGLSFALHMVFLPAGSTAHTALPTRERLSFSHSLSHTHTHTHTYSLARSIDRFLVRSGRPLLLLQSDDRKERRIDGCYRPWRREGHEGSLRQLVVLVASRLARLMPMTTFGVFIGACVPGPCNAFSYLPNLRKSACAQPARRDGRRVRRPVRCARR